MKASMIARLALSPVSCLAWTFRPSSFSAGNKACRSGFSTSFRRPTCRWVASTPPSTSSGSSAASTPEEEASKRGKEVPRLLGGDFAGFSTQCDPVTGEAEPVPVYLVPPSMLEWGQHPKALEVIVSEDIVESLSSNSNPTESSTTWDRTCLTVLPETGCGVDNLEVQKSIETDWRVLHAADDSDGNCVGLMRTTGTSSCMIETIFGLQVDDDKDGHRLRVTVVLDAESRIKSIGLSYERRFDNTSTHGSRADGGGLDGASVSRWMGPLIAKQGVQTLENRLVEPSKDKGGDSSTIIKLPANVTVQYRMDEEEESLCLLTISHGSGHCMDYEWKAGNFDTIHVVS